MKFKLVDLRTIYLVTAESDESYMREDGVWYEAACLNGRELVTDANQIRELEQALIDYWSLN